MKRSQLNDEKKNEYDQIVDEMMAEIDKIPRENTERHGFSSYLAKQYKQIEDKYLPKLNAILASAEA